MGVPVRHDWTGFAVVASPPVVGFCGQPPNAFGRESSGSQMQPPPPAPATVVAHSIARLRPDVTIGSESAGKQNSQWSPPNNPPQTLCPPNMSWNAGTTTKATCVRTGQWPKSPAWGAGVLTWGSCAPPPPPLGTIFGNPFEF